MAHPTLPLMLVLVPQGQHSIAEASSGSWMTVEVPVSAFVVEAGLDVLGACSLMEFIVQGCFAGFVCRDGAGKCSDGIELVCCDDSRSACPVRFAGLAVVVWSDGPLCRE